MSNNAQPQSPRFLRRPAVEARYGVSTASIYRWIKIGAFPMPRRIGPGAVAWRVDELDAFDEDPDAWREKHAAA
ncbi:MAG TPA: AlpA family phage regulatory protein [Gammaproteobacteria bacterium]|nr:AlpA family phage regulatory protein [Gammaproteobacteria bacterium]